MNLRAVDLNLLVIFDALMRERHVSRAAQRVGLSQPAASSALSRLRHLFGDELLVRSGNGMEPTARALELAERIGPILREVGRLGEDDAAFDPATSSAHFHLRMSDLLLLVLMPALENRLETEAPGVTLDVQHLSPTDTVDALMADALDMAVSTQLDTPAAIVDEHLSDGRMVCVHRRGHPAINGAVSLDAFRALKHIRVAQNVLDDRFVDKQLAALGIERRVALTLPHWLTVPAILGRTDLVSVMPEQHAAEFTESHGLAYVDVPFPGADFHWSLYWHKRHGAHPAHRWLRGLVREVAAAP
ncbi:MAG: LysR family transcriptional regulator [Rhodospirillaceae bacterium]